MHESSEVFNTKEGGGVHFTCKTHTVKTVGSKKHILLSPYMQ